MEEACVNRAGGGPDCDPRKVAPHGGPVNPLLG